MQNRELPRRVALVRRKITTAKAFRSARIRAGLSVAELSKRSGVSAQQLHKIEAGQHTRPRMETARAVAGALGVEVTDLLVCEVAA